MSKQRQRSPSRCCFSTKAYCDGGELTALCTGQPLQLTYASAKSCASTRFCSGWLLSSLHEWIVMAGGRSAPLPPQRRSIAHGAVAKHFRQISRVVVNYHTLALGRTNRRGNCVFWTTLSVMLPQTQRMMPVRPCVAIASRSYSLESPRLGVVPASREASSTFCPAAGSFPSTILTRVSATSVPSTTSQLAASPGWAPARRFATLLR